MREHIFQPSAGDTTCAVVVNGWVCGRTRAAHSTKTRVETVELPEEPKKATDHQVGGDHYARNKIQPIEYIVQNDLDWFSGNVVKYITRFRHKNGKQDLEKVIHYAQLAIEHYYPEEDDDEA